MKKYISHLVFALLGCAALSACVDDDYMELDKGQNELVKMSLDRNKKKFFLISSRTGYKPKEFDFILMKKTKLPDYLYIFGIYKIRAI